MNLMKLLGQSMILIITLLTITSLSSQEYDLVVLNGRVVDGSGNNWKYNDIGIKGNKIVTIGQLSTDDGIKVVDAAGQIVCPGFIDVHAHVEGSLENRPGANNFVLDGVTTVITGNCGGSRPDLATYFRKIDSIGICINMASLIGHNTVRRTVMGNEDRAPTIEELKNMKSMVKKAMKDGAVGLSTGLIYLPGSFAQTDEIIELAKVANEHGGVYVSHIRQEDERIYDAIKEAADVGIGANIPVEISHFKIAGKNNWGQSIRTINMIKEYRKSGLDITVDQYPYTASSTRLGVVLPDWAREGTTEDLQKRLDDPDTRKGIKQEMKEILAKTGFSNYAYAVVAFYPADPSVNGLSISDVNIKWGKENTLDNEIETILKMVYPGKRVQMVYHKMNEEDVGRIMKYPFTMIASDAGIPAFDIGSPHPRAYGTNARVLGKYVREEKIIGLEDAIRKMTSLPAQKFNLNDRGLLRPGMAADINIFDENIVDDQATFKASHTYSIGFDYVIVNGKIVVEKGKHLGTAAGKILMGPGFPD